MIFAFKYIIPADFVMHKPGIFYVKTCFISAYDINFFSDVFSAFWRA